MDLYTQLLMPYSCDSGVCASPNSSCFHPAAKEALSKSNLNTAPCCLTCSHIEWNTHMTGRDMDHKDQRDNYVRQTSQAIYMVHMHRCCLQTSTHISTWSNRPFGKYGSKELRACWHRSKLQSTYNDAAWLWRPQHALYNLCVLSTLSASM